MAAVLSDGHFELDAIGRRVSTAEDEHRQRLARKAWRCRCLFRKVDRMLTLLLLGVLGVWLEHVLASIMHLDTTPNGLWDAVRPCSANPFRRARNRIAWVVMQGFNGPLRHILAFFEEHTDIPIGPRILNDARTMGINFVTQLTWRFLHLTTFPCLWALYCHPHLQASEQLKVVDRFYALNDCCRRREWCAKLRALIPSAQELVDNDDYRKLCYAFVRAWLWTNMAMERLLALIRKSYNGTVDAERALCSGLWCQVLQEHKQLGRADPRARSRDELLAEGGLLLAVYVMAYGHGHPRPQPWPRRHGRSNGHLFITHSIYVIPFMFGMWNVLPIA